MLVCKICHFAFLPSDCRRTKLKGRWQSYVASEGLVPGAEKGSSIR